MGLPGETRLEPNYPNPFNPSTTIQLTIATRQLAVVTVYDLLGREIATLLNEVKEPGTYRVPFDGRGLSGGVYFARLAAGEQRNIQKMIFAK